MDECEKLSATLHALEGAFRRRAERARDERDIATMVRMRDAARASNERKTELAALAGDLATDLAYAQAAATPASTTTTSAPAWAANALTTAPPARKFATICAVTSAG